MPDPRVEDPRDTKVRPRLVWAGMGSAILALAVAGVGLMMQQLCIAWVSGAVVVIGLVVARRGGVEYDTRGQEPPHHEVKEVVEGGEHEGVSPDSRAVGAEVEAKAAAVTRHTERLLAEAQGTWSVGTGPLASYGLIVVGAWLVLGQGFLSYPFTVTGQDSALRDVGFAVVLVLSGLRLRLPRRSILAASLCLLCGVLLVLSGLFLPHDSPAIKVDEVVAGAVVLGFMALLVSPRARPRRRERRERTGR